MIGSIYQEVLPKQDLYDASQTIYKPIAYGSAKAAQIPLLKQASTFLGDKGGRCNMASFGGIETKSQSQWFKMKYEDYSPMNKMVQSQEAIELIT